MASTEQAAPDPKSPMEAPPDVPMAENGDPPRSTKKFKAMKRSFADTVGSPPPLVEEEQPQSDEHDWAFEDPEVESDIEMDDQDISDGRPRVIIPKAIRQELCKEWRLALILKYLGKNINFNVLNQRLSSMWRLQGKYNLIEMGYGCFIVRFDNRKDYLHALLDGPWKIFDNYLVTQRWEPEFRPRSAKLSKMAVWVRLPELPVEYFKDNIIKTILEGVGKPLKLDRTTVSREKGRFARAAVEVDLSKPLVTEVVMGNDVQMVEYEGLHVVCFGCGVVGHREQDCPLTKTAPVDSSNININEVPPMEPDMATEVTKEPARGKVANTPRGYGPWMLVTRKPKAPAKNMNHNQTKNTNHNQGKNKSQNQVKKAGDTSHNNSNQFNVLADKGSGDAQTQKSKGKAKAVGESREISKGKSPIFSNSSQNPFRQDMAPTPQYVNRGNPGPSVKGRGGGSVASRRRGSDRGASTSRAIPPSSGGISDNGIGNFVFQFGRTAPPTARQNTMGSPPVAAGDPNCCSPGDGANQSSPLPTVSS